MRWIRPKPNAPGRWWNSRCGCHLASPDSILEVNHLAADTCRSKADTHAMEEATAAATATAARGEERPAAAVLEGGRRGAIPPPPSALAGLLVRPAMVDGCYWLYLSECGEQVEVNDAGC